MWQYVTGAWRNFSREWQIDAQREKEKEKGGTKHITHVIHTEKTRGAVAKLCAATQREITRTRVIGENEQRDRERENENWWERERERNCKIENGEKGSTKVRQSTHDVSKRNKKKNATCSCKRDVHARVRLMRVRERERKRKQIGRWARCTWSYVWGVGSSVLHNLCRYILYVCRYITKYIDGKRK